MWCPRGDSTPHAFRPSILSAVRLPFRHQGLWGNRCPIGSISVDILVSSDLTLLRAVGLPHFSYGERSTIKQRMWPLLQDSNL